MRRRRSINTEYVRFVIYMLVLAALWLLRPTPQTAAQAANAAIEQSN